MIEEKKIPACISVVIPVYGEGFNASEIVDSFTKELLIFSDFEIIFINDHKKDSNWDQIVEEKKKSSHVKGICFTKNFGQHRAIHSGVKLSKFEYVVVADCDGQDDPKEIINFYNTLVSKNGDVVLGLRDERKDNFLSIFLSKLFYYLLKFLSDIDHDSRSSSYGMVTRKVIKTYLDFNENFKTFGMILRVSGFEVLKISINHRKRNNGVSNYNLLKKVELGLEIILANSNKPLKLSVFIGLLFFIVSLILITTYCYKFVCFGNDSVSQINILIACLFLTSGTLSMILGVLGLYVGRVYDEVKNRPYYIIDEKI